MECMSVARWVRQHPAVTLVAAGALAATTAAVPLGTATAGTTPSAVDYAQCANGAPPSEAVNCERGWINGILQKSNSHFREGDVTPQRLEVFVAPGDHTLTLRYQARKGTIHAYDNLAQYNLTVTDADRCDGLSTPKKKDIGCDSSTVTPTTWPVPLDDTSVSPAGTGLSTTTSDHLPDSLGDFIMYGGSLTGVDGPTHDNATGSGDDYATVTIHYSTSGTANSNVQLLFGGHVAIGNPARGGWGTGFGASSVSGGPYHIKWDGADGASVGSRDNQLMGDSILPPAETSISTTPSVTSANYGASSLANVTDTATIIGGNNPTGTMTFDLYGPFSTAPSATSCVDPATGVTGNRLVQKTVLVTSTSVTSDPPVDMSGYAPGIYVWVASYSGDNNNAPAAGVCNETGELVTIGKASPSISTSPSTTSGTVGDSTLSGVTDTATLTNGYSVSGTVTFDLYGPFSSAPLATSCVDPATGVTGNRLVHETSVTVSSGSATSTAVDMTTSTYTPGIYVWVARYSGDTNNNSKDGSCTDTSETVTISQATPGATSTQSVEDTVTVTGYTPTGTVDFYLYSDSGCTALVNSDTDVSLTAGVATSKLIGPLSGGTYYWQVNYDGDTNNASGIVEACGVQQVTIQNALPTT